MTARNLRQSLDFILTPTADHVLPELEVPCYSCGTNLGAIATKELKRSNAQGYFTLALRRLHRPHAKDPATLASCLSLLWVECPLEVAGNPNTPPETLERLSFEPLPVRMALYGNPVLPMMATELYPWVLDFFAKRGLYEERGV
jgi:hypothetical protein